ncbi:MAG TPA: DUF3180 domain-containing protein [Micromonosporaceae bacterium]
MTGEPSVPPSPPSQRPPRLRPTRPATLVVTGLAAAALAWLGISRWYFDIPALPWLPALTVGALAAIEAVTAISTKARIDRKPGTAPVDPLAVARYAVLAKASSLAGSIFAGVYGATLAWLVANRWNSHANADLPAAIAGLVTSLALIAAALWLEHACRVPKRPEDEDKPE